jgi:hypothetical protein
MTRVAQAVSWQRLPDEQLLQLRFCDLKLQLRGSPLERRLQRLYTELADRGIRFRPHMWLAEEWFSPDDIPGIAVPFYLAHPRLQRLERHMMKQVEGGNTNWLMRILRHEAGHAFDTAYRLRRRARWRAVFGSSALPYPERYRAKPGSRHFVQHLGDWYAQSHPTEDFAETFAVWLKPRSNWRKTYADWPALEKLQFVDEIVSDFAAQPALVRSRRQMEPLSQNRRTLAEHYEEKIRFRQVSYSENIDAHLRRTFNRHPPKHSAVRTAVYLRAHRRELVQSVMKTTDADRYTAHQVLRIAIDRADHLRLYLRGTQRQALPDARWLLGGLVRLLGQGERPQLVL